MLLLKSLALRALAIIRPRLRSTPREPTDGEVAFEAEPVAADQITETLDCDLLVIGAGIAGICAAASAVQNGLSVVLLEKTSTYQIQAGEIGAVGGKVLDAAGFAADPVEYYNEAMEHASYRCDGDVWQVYIDRSGEAHRLVRGRDRRRRLRRMEPGVGGGSLRQRHQLARYGYCA